MTNLITAACRINLCQFGGARRVVGALSFALLASFVHADGSETLGPASVTPANGTGLVAAGIGLTEGPNTINLDIPAGVSVVQTLLYWGGVDSPEPIPAPATDTISVGGTTVTGSLIGGPVFLNPAGGGRYSSAYRADITGLGLVSPGTNAVAIGGLDFSFEQSGAGMLVVVDDGGDTGPTLLRDGVDFAFVNAPSPRDTTVAQTFSFDAAPTARTIPLNLFFNNLKGVDSSSIIEVVVAGGTPTQTNNAGSTDGPEWNTLVIDIAVPAGADSITVQALSADDQANLSSFNWIMAGLNIPAYVNRDGEIGDVVWKDLSGDGIRDSGEPGVPDFTVNLYDDVNNLLQSMTTEADGSYVFQNLEVPGTYQVEFVNDPAMNMPFTIADVGDDTTDSDAGPDGRSPFIGLSAADPTDFSIDAGLVNPPALAGLGDFVWKDGNSNGQQDPGEPGIDGIGVNLLDGTGATTGMSTVTASGGLYQFANLDPGDYIVEFVNDPAMNMEFTAAGQGDDVSDSDADSTTGRTGLVSLAAGEFNSTVDAGLVDVVIASDLPSCKLLVSNRRGHGLLYLKFADRGSIIDYIRGDTIITVPAIYTTRADQPNSAGPGSDDNLRDGVRYNDDVITAYVSKRQRFFRLRNRKTREISYFMSTRTKNVADMAIGDGATAVQCESIRFSPIALDLNGDGRISRTNEGVSFDFAANGVTRTTSAWFGASEGILYDTRVAGEVTGAHLFGNEGGSYADGFAKLARLDANADGRVSGAELRGLALWVDNGNARVDPGELQSLAAHGIVALPTEHTHMRAQAELANGGRMLMEDVWFTAAAPATNAKPLLWLSGIGIIALVLVAAMGGASGRRQRLVPAA